MGSEYTPVFVFILFAAGIAFGFLGITHLLGPRKPTRVKQMPYESGMDPFGDARRRFDIQYYLVAIAFLLFDVELLFLYPWVVAQWSVDAPAPGLPAPTSAGALPALGVGVPVMFRGLVFIEIFVFVAVLAAAFAYAWRKGAFEWR